MSRLRARWLPRVSSKLVAALASTLRSSSSLKERILLRLLFAATIPAATLSLNSATFDRHHFSIALMLLRYLFTVSGVMTP